MSRKLDMVIEKLEKIVEGEHEEGCKFKSCPRWECPKCPGPEELASDALKVLRVLREMRNESEN